MLMPQAAVIEVQSVYQVAVVGPDNKAAFRMVTVGDQVGTDWIITDGLKPGDKVIVQGFMKLREGTPVNPNPMWPLPRRATTMSKFFIRRPIVAIVISILTVIGGVIALLRLPMAQFPEISRSADPGGGQLTPARMPTRSPSRWRPRLSSRWRASTE